MNRNPSFSGMIYFYFYFSQLNCEKGRKRQEQYRSGEAKRKIQPHFSTIYKKDSRTTLLWVGRGGFQGYFSLSVNGLRHAAEIHTQLILLQLN